MRHLNLKMRLVSHELSLELFKDNHGKDHAKSIVQRQSYKRLYKISHIYIPGLWNFLSLELG
jgi:hypothetical protein